MPQSPANPLAWGAPSGSVEQMGRRTRQSKTFRHAENPSRYTTVIGGTLHYEPTPGAGAWEDADTTLRTSGPTVAADHLPFSISLNGRNLDVVDRATGKGIRYTLPAVGVTVGTNTLSFTWDGIAWVYTVTTEGLKLTATISSPRGTQPFSMPFARMGAAGAMTVLPDGSIQGDGYTLPAPFAVGADGKIYRIGAWTVGQTALSFTWNDTAIPLSAYPYVFDPSTAVSVASSSEDGRAQRGPESTYPPPSTTQAVNTAADNDTALKDFDSGASQHYLYVGLIRWNTSAIPDAATITAATLRLNVISKQDADSRSLTAEWYDHGGIDVSDWTSTVGTDAHAGTTIASITASNTDNDFALTNLSSISKTGNTGLRLHVSGGAPTGNNEVVWASFDHASLAEPRLIITWTAPSGIYALDGQSVTSSGTSATVISATLPTAPAQGDLLVAMVDCAGSVTPTVASDWNKLTQIQSTDTGCMFWKICGAGESATQNLTTANTGSSWAVVIQVFAGADQTSTLLVQNNQASTTTSKASPSVSPTSGKINALIVGGAFSDGGSRTWSSSAFTGSNVGTVTNAGTASRGTGTAGENATLWYAVVSSTTGSYTATVTCSAADGGGAAVAVFNPASAATAKAPQPRRRSGMRSFTRRRAA